MTNTVKTKQGWAWLLVLGAVAMLLPFPTVSAAAYFSDNMESAATATNWTVSSPWALATGPGAFHSTTKAWSDSPGYYANNADTSLTMNVDVNLGAAVSPQLVFWHKYELETDFDFGYLEISVDSGTSWLPVRLAAYTGVAGWQREQIDLTSFQGQANVKIRFRLVTDKTVVWDGWYIDDVSVAEPPNPVATFEVRNPTATTLELVWATSLATDFASYKIYRSTSPGVSTGSALIATITNQATTAFTDQNLLPNTTYYYKVYVFNGNDLAAGDKEASGTTPLARFAYPFFDDLEGAVGGWQPNAPWQVTELPLNDYHPGWTPPSTAPNQNFTKVWTDSPAGAYASGADTSLALSIDMGTAVMPVLSFWHRYTFGANDYGYVEVREVGTSTWKRLYFAEGVLSAWSRESIDLSSYAKKQVDIRFRIMTDTAAQPTNSDGWYIDDLSIGETQHGPIVYPFMDPLETLDHWHSSSWDLVTGGNQGGWALTDSPAGNYGAETSSELIMANTMTLGSAGSHPQLSFWHKYEITSRDYSSYCGYTTEYDYGRVYLSTNKGQAGTWTQLASFKGSQSAWKKEQIDLSNWAGLPDIRVKFVMEDNRSANGSCTERLAGWTIDDVVVEEMPLDVVLSITATSMNTVDLSWTPNADADFDHYELYRSTAPNVMRNGTLIAVINGKDTTSHADAVAIVQPGTYYYRLWVIDRDGNTSLGSNEVQATYTVPLNAYPFTEDGEGGTAKWSWGAPWGLTDASKYGESGYSWTDSPGANYQANANTSLTTFLNLTNSTNPVLSFWHKYSLEEGKDFVRLEVSTDNGMTWAALRAFTGTENFWNQERVNLTAYTGSAKLGLRFRLTADGQNHQDGWYLDNLTIQEESVRAGYPFNDGMEAGTAPWFYDSPWGIVQLAAADSRTGLAASRVWSDSPEGAYAAGADTSLQLSIDLGSAQIPVLSFWHRYAFEANADYGYVEVRDGSTSPWKRLFFVTGASASWVKADVDLASYAGRQVDIRFRVVAGTGVQSEGWLIDDIRIGETEAPAIAYPFIDHLERTDKWFTSSWGLVTGDGRGDASAIADSPGGPYGAEVSSEFIMANVMDLKLAGNPQLSFWHKYEITSRDYSSYCGYTTEYDYGRVYLSTNKGQAGTWTLLASFKGSQSAWKKEQIDLSNWAGLPDIRVKFVMEDNRSANGNCTERLTGWTIDDVALEDAPVDVALSVASSSMDTVVLNWTRNGDTDFDRYEIYRSPSPNVTRSATLIKTETTNDGTAYTDPVAIVQPGTYYYRAWVVDRDGNVSMGSNEVQATYTVPSGTYPFLENGESGTARWSWGSPWGLTDVEKLGAGGYSWTDSPGANYAAYADTSLTAFLNLTGSTNPVLTFWHKYSLETGKDFIYLEVSTNNGQTWATLKSYTGEEMAWNRERVNLTPYTGNAKLGLRFRLVADGQNQQDGWYMDDLQIKEESVRAGYPFADNMEGEIAPWFYDSPWGIMQLEAGQSRNDAASKVWADSPGGAYNAGADSSLHLSIDLGSAQMPVLSFWHKYSFEANADYGYIEVKEVGSSTWKRLYFITGTSPSWIEARVDLANYAGRQLDIRFRVVSDTNNVNSDGWLIDDVRIEETKTAALPYPFTEDFETSAATANWIFSSWSMAGGTDAHTGTYGMTDSSSGSYGSEVKSELILGNVLSLRGAANPQLSFWHKYEITSRDYSSYCGYTTEYDYARVYLSTLKGQPGTWTQLASFKGSKVWEKQTIDLKSWAGLPEVRIKFVMEDNRSANGNCTERLAGWTLDDIRIGENETIPSNIAIISGNTQLGQTGYPLADPFVVRITDTASRPQAGIPVAFAVTGGEGSLSVLEGTSDASGLVATILTLGAAAGAHTVSATLPGTNPVQTVTFTATGHAAGQAMAVAKVSGDNQVGEVSSALANPLVVKVTDILGNGVGNVNVTFSRLSGAGTLTPAAATTNSEGLASSNFTLGDSTGVATISVTAAGLTGSPVAFTANAVLAGGSLGDTDGDGMPDAWENKYGLNPLEPADAALDGDADGLTNLQEYTLGTDPQKTDTDGDGMPDRWEVQYGLNPRDPADAAKDYNNNGKTNLQEYLEGTSPVYRKHFNLAGATTESMDIYGLAAIDGVAVQPGDEIAALCPGGVVCGQYTVEKAGEYGFMHVYRDDPGTTQVEGALPGNPLIFRIWDAGAGVELDATATVITGGAPPTWTSNGDSARINLNAGGKQIIPLAAGWNLISFAVKNCYYVGDSIPTAPLLTGINFIKMDSIADVLQSIDGLYEVVRSFDNAGAHTFDPLLPQFSDLKYLAGGYGYWIKMKAAGNLELTGLKALPTDSLELRTGWNMVGYWGHDVRYVGSRPTVHFPPDATTFTPLFSLNEGFSAIAGNYSVVRSFDQGQPGGSHTYDPGLPGLYNDMQYIGPGYGMWIKMKTPDDLSY